MYVYVTDFDRKWFASSEQVKRGEAQDEDKNQVKKAEDKSKKLSKMEEARWNFVPETLPNNFLFDKL